MGQRVTVLVLCVVDGGWANGGWLVGHCARKGETVITVGSKGVEAGAWLPATEHVEDVSPYALNAMVFDEGWERSSTCR